MYTWFFFAQHLKAAKSRQTSGAEEQTSSRYRTLYPPAGSTLHPASSTVKYKLFFPLHLTDFSSALLPSFLTDNAVCILLGYIWVSVLHLRIFFQFSEIFMILKKSSAVKLMENQF
jgi:hypothetical protein